MQIETQEILTELFSKEKSRAQEVEKDSPYL